jgi:phosphoribosyl-ATP pyrophosphohydrolase/phosphoribosyl-AMP cyclohydrolase
MPSLPLKFDPRGLVPAIVQDHLTGQVRMFAYATETAVRKTLETGYATFWSRSRGELWQKRRASAQETPVVRVLADCDGDCIIYSSDPRAPSCDSGAPSCFFHAVEGERMVHASEQPQTLLARLESVPVLAGAPQGAGDLARALASESDERVIHEAADTLHRLVVGLRARSISLRLVLAELATRLGHEASPAPRA